MVQLGQRDATVVFESKPWQRPGDEQLTISFAIERNRGRINFWYFLINSLGSRTCGFPASLSLTIRQFAAGYWLGLGVANDMPSKTLRGAEKKALEGENESQDTLEVFNRLVQGYGVGIVSSW